MRRALFVTLLLLLGVPAARPAPLPPRPLSGCGVLCIPAGIASEELLTIYAHPGVQRLTLLPLSRVPRLSRSDADTVLATLERKGRWLKISYDDAERQGWIEPPRRWEFLRWQEALPGRSARILPAMKKGYYSVRQTPSEGGAPLGELKRDQVVRIVAVKDDWARLEAPAGWFRWRDAEGRLTISPGAARPAEKR